MDEHSLKRLAIIILTAVILILVFRSVGLRMATKAGQEHQKAVAARQANTAPAPDRPPPAPDAQDAMIPPPLDAAQASAPNATPEAAPPAPAPAAPTVQDAGAPAAAPGQAPAPNAAAAPAGN